MFFSPSSPFRCFTIAAVWKHKDMDLAILQFWDNAKERAVPKHFPIF